MNQSEKQTIENCLVKFWEHLPEGLVDDLAFGGFIDYERTIQKANKEQRLIDKEDSV